MASVGLQTARHGWRSVTNLAETFQNAAGGLVVSLLGTYLISLCQAPKLLDSEQAAYTAKLEAAKQAVEAELESARQDVATPKVSSLERSKRERVANLLPNLTEPEREVLKYLLHFGPTEPRILSERHGVQTMGMATWGKAMQNQIMVVVPKTARSPVFWDINPELRKALEFHLLGE